MFVKKARHRSCDQKYLAKEFRGAWVKAEGSKIGVLVPLDTAIGSMVNRTILLLACGPGSSDEYEVAEADVAMPG